MMGNTGPSRSATAKPAPWVVSARIRDALSASERAALEVCRRFADEGRRITQYDICEAIGSENWNGGTMAGVLNRLEAKGYITRTIYQRGVQICIAETGKCTFPPDDKTPHWRLRTDRTPAPAIQSVKQQAPNEAKEIEQDARDRGLSYHQHMMDLVLIGHRIFREGPK